MEQGKNMIDIEKQLRGWGWRLKNRFCHGMRKRLAWWIVSEELKMKSPVHGDRTVNFLNWFKQLKARTQYLRNRIRRCVIKPMLQRKLQELQGLKIPNSKIILAEKDNALVFITRERNLRINEAAAVGQIKELKQLLSEASEKEFTVEDKEKQKP